MQKAEWLSQVRKGILEYVILIVMEERAIYGYDLLSKLNGYEVFATAEGTIYPLLRRMEKNGLIASLWQETSPGVPPRKYYSLTALGRQSLAMMHREFDDLIAARNLLCRQREENRA